MQDVSRPSRRSSGIRGFRTFLVAALVAAAFAVTYGCGAQRASEGTASATAPEIPELQFEKYELPNGLDVILLEDHRLPLVAVNVWYHVGPAHERPGRTGFAHLFEHMMFQGSKHVPDDAHFRLLEAAGASEINGTTGFDRTNYFQTLPSNQLELALWLESDRMGFMLETLDAQKLENQRDVVRNERRQSVENRPYGLVEEALFHQLFPKGHPYYASIIGSHADIQAASLEDVREFFRQYYGPNNASIAIVGDIDREKTRALVEKYFGSIPSGPPVPKIDVTTPPITSERRVTVTDQVELPRLYMAWLTPSIYAPGDAEADLLAILLGGGKSSRLYKKLVYDLKIAQDVSASQSSMLLTSVFSIEATAKPGVTLEELEKAIDAELEAIREKGPQAIELERARNTIEAQVLRGLERLGGFGGVADRLNQYNFYVGDPGYLATDLGRYRKVTEGGVREFAREHLAQNRRVVVYGVPGQKVIEDVPRTTEAAGTGLQTLTAQQDASTTRDESWRANPPAPGPDPKLSLPVPQRFTLPNGLTVLLVEKHELPVVAASLVVLSGSDVNPPDKPGLANFTADMLDEGTKTRSALEIADAFAQIGATFVSGSGSDYSNVGVLTLKQHVDRAFELVADVTLNPVFAEEEIERVRNDRLTRLLQQRDAPTALAAKIFNRVVYGTDHPYGYIELGTEESLKAITRDDLVRFWQAGYVPENAALAVAGAITMNELRELAEKHFGAWQGTSERLERPEVKDSVEPRIVVVDRPGSPQTALRMGHVGVPRAHPDYVALQVMNTTLGGLFSSRINMNLREKNGYTYGAGSGFGFRRGAGPFIVATSVRTDVTAPAIREILKEIELMRTAPVTTQELETARDAFARSLPGLFETSSQTAASIGQLFVYELPLDYFNNLPGAIQAVGAEDVQRVAREHLEPRRMVIVAVGDRARIETELRKLGYGRVEVRDYEGRLVNGSAAASSR